MRDSRRLGALVVAICLAAHATAHQLPAFRAETRLVVLQVTVTNGDGQLVTDLDRRAFSVYEDGRPQPIALFNRNDIPISLGLLIDNSGSMRSLRAGVEAAALAFVRASNPLDDVFVLNFADIPRIDVPFTSDVSVLTAGIARVDSIGGTALRDAILMGERYLGERASHDRRVLLIITDGNDNASHASVTDLRKVVARSSAMIFAVSLADEHRPTAARQHGKDLELVTEPTGGAVEYVGSLGEIDAVVLDIAHRIRNQYVIAYTPTNQALDGSYRAVRVKVTTARGLTARTRLGYRASAAPSDVP
jgi:Ca-activated chloride channel family protein